MKLVWKLVLPPLLTAAVALGGGAVNGVWMSVEAQRSASLFDDNLQSLRSISSAQAQLGQMHAEVYRELTLVASQDEAQVQQWRQAMGQQVQGVTRVVGDVITQVAVGEAAQAQAGKLSEELQRYGKLVDDAVDLASVDPNTGVAAMQGADQRFQAASQTLAQLVDAIEAATQQQREASAQQARWQVLALVGMTVLVTAVVLWLSLGVLRRLVSAVKQACDLAETVAAGRLTQQVQVDRDDEIGDLQRAMGQMVARLRGSLQTVRQVAGTIASASAEFASGNQDLSQRTEQAASNLQRTASSMQQLTGGVCQSADAAAQANQLASSAAGAAQRGGAVVGQVVSNMQDIANASRRIVDIIGVIDGIAFQTNILALNAAVEAARAGEQGRGFAVVAGEVRSLAGRSASAAREIKQLIAASVEKVDNGTRLVQDAGSTMSEIVGSVGQVSDILGELNAGSAAQRDGMGQVDQAVGQLDQMTQQNAALVEQSAAAAENLKSQATRLSELVAGFELGEAVMAMEPG